MPYSQNNLPENIKKLPEKSQNQWIAIWDSAYAKAIKDGDSKDEAEQSAFKQANDTVLSPAQQKANSQGKGKGQAFGKGEGPVGVPKLHDPQFFIQLSEDAQDTKILYVGKFSHALYGDFEITEKDIDSAINNFVSGVAVRVDENGENELPANYQHASYDKDPNKSKSSGWIKSLYKKGKELWAKVDWTEKALEYIKNKEFKYISPEFVKDWKDENGKKQGFTVLGLALTNVNFLKKNMPALALMDDGENLISFGELEKFVNMTPVKDKLFRAKGAIYQLERLITERINDKQITTLDELQKFVDDNILDLKKIMKEKFNEKNSNKEILYTNQNNEDIIMQEKLIKLLNLDEGSEESAVLDAVTKLTEDNADFEKKVQDLEKDISEKDSELKKLTESNTEIDLVEINNQIKTLTEKNTTLENKLQIEEAKKAIEGYVFNMTTGKGKIFPKQTDEWVKLWLADSEGIKKLLDDMPDVINFKESGSSADNDSEKDQDPSSELNRKATELVAKDKIEFSDAMNKVLESDPDLKKRYFEFTK